MYICGSCQRGIHYHKTNACPATWTDSLCGCKQPGLIMSESKSRLYARQSKEAEENIRSMPAWMQKNMGIKPEMVKKGSTLKLVFQDNWGRVLYTEPFTYDIYLSSSQVESVLDAFRTGILDALKNIQRDIEYTEDIQEIPTHILKQELTRREE